MHKVVDLRSDTVTQPPPAMRDAMRDAVVGDDILGEDPTVRRLEELAAEMLGMEAGLFTASGTMSNQVAVMTLTRPGQEVIVSRRSHIFNLEVGGLAAVSGVQARTVPTRDGVYDPEALRAALRPDGVQFPCTGLICLENTYDLDLGRAVPPDRTRGVLETAAEAGLPVHLDGARLFNAAVTLGVEPATLTRGCTSACFCLSKALCAPVGSILAGPRDFIAEARRVKQRLGGGWRQGGIIAAAGIYGLERMVDRLAEDHGRAARLADGLRRLGIEVHPTDMMSNIVQLSLDPAGIDADGLLAHLREEGIRAKRCSSRIIRMVLHNDVAEEDVARVLQSAEEAINGSGRQTG